jgi:DNA-binding response OmpR family regulator
MATARVRVVRDPFTNGPAPREAGAMPVRTARVLIVDDDPAVLELVADLLAGEGFAVSRAGDGVEALAAAERERPDLVVSDVWMPRLDGLGLAERLRGLGVPVVLMSAVLERPPAGGLPFVAKPFDLDALLAAVRWALDGQEEGAASWPPPPAPAPHGRSSGGRGQRSTPGGGPG